MKIPSFRWEQAETEAEYDYADGVTLVLSEFSDGASAEVEIPDTKGNTVMKAYAVRKGDEIEVSVEGRNGNFTVKNLGSGTVVVK